MISVEDWTEIRRLHRAEGMGVKAIARRRVSEPGASGAAGRRRRRTTSGPERLVDRRRRGARGPASCYGKLPDIAAHRDGQRIGWERSIRVLANGWLSCGAAMRTILSGSRCTSSS